MNLEKDYVYEIENEVAELNEHNILKPYGYQKLFAEVAEKHLLNLNIDFDITKQSGLAWVIVSLSIEIIKPVTGCVKMTANTWYSQHKGPFFRREMIFKNSNDEIMFKSSAFSVLIDINTRKLFRSDKIPFKLYEPKEIFAIEASPTFKINTEFTEIEKRKVYNSFIDCLGHVNNIRYGEFSYDSLTEKEKNNLAALKRIDLYFLSELRSNDSFTILKAYKDNKIIIKGFNNVKDNTAFNVVFTY